VTARRLPDWSCLLLLALVVQVGFVLTKWSGCELLEDTTWREMGMLLPTAFAPPLLFYLLGRSKGTKK